MVYLRASPARVRCSTADCLTHVQMSPMQWFELQAFVGPTNKLFHPGTLESPSLSKLYNGLRGRTRQTMSRQPNVVLFVFTSKMFYAHSRRSRFVWLNRFACHGASCRVMASTFTVTVLLNVYDHFRAGLPTPAYGRQTFCCLVLLFAVFDSSCVSR